MKKIILLPIILGAVLLTAGAALFTYGLVKSTKSDTVEENVYEFNDKTITNFDIDISIADLEFVPTTDGTKKVVCKETTKEYHEVSVINDALTIRHVENKKWYEHIFDFNFSKRTVTIYVPAEAYNDFKLESATGDVKIPNNFSFASFTAKLSTGNVDISSNVAGTVDINTSTGNISLTNMAANSLDLEASTGNINLNKVVVTETIESKTSTGNFKTKDVTAQNLKVKTSTGYVNLANTVIANNINIKTNTGDVHFDDSDAATLDIKTDTGDVTGSLLTSKVFYVTTDTGKVNVPKSTTGGLCNIETDTGDVRIIINE